MFYTSFYLVSVLYVALTTKRIIVDELIRCDNCSSFKTGVYQLQELHDSWYSILESRLRHDVINLFSTDIPWAFPCMNLSFWMLKPCIREPTGYSPHKIQQVVSLSHFSSRVPKSLQLWSLYLPNFLINLKRVPPNFGNYMG